MLLIHGALFRICRINIDTYHLNASFRDYKQAFTAQDNYRVISLLLDDRLSACMKDYVMPEWILLGVNNSSELFLRYRPDLFDIKDIPTISFNPFAKQGIVGAILYQNLLNFIVSDYADAEDVFRFVEDWNVNLQNMGDAVQAYYKTFTENRYDAALNYRKLYDAIINVVDLFAFDADMMRLCMSIKERDKVKRLLSLFQDRDYFVARHFDLYYSRSKSGFGRLSSGEWDMLKLFSRIYDAIVLKPNRFSNIKHSSVLLLDEAENCFHPEWQRCFVATLTEFLNAMDVNKDSFQVVLTSHSPVMLSDIPKCCVTFLQKEEGVARNVSAEHGETFGANVFDMYYHLFFLSENGGTLSTEKLKNIVDKIHRILIDKESSALSKEDWWLLDHAGDPQVQKYFDSVKPLVRKALK